MAKYLVDANLPYYFSIWKNKDYIHVYDLNDEWSDQKIWEYAKEYNLTIISKDTDFYNFILVSSPPPKVIFLKIGNMKIDELHDFLNEVWEEVLSLSKECKHVTVHNDHIEGVN